MPAADRYSAPKAKVDDIGPEPARAAVRSTWYGLACVLLFGGYLAVLLLWKGGKEELLVPGMIGLVAGAALGAYGARAIYTRRSGFMPWWWDALLYSITVGFFAGLVIEYAALIMVNLVALVVILVVSLGAVWVVEARYRVRVYTVMALRSGLRFTDREDTR